MFIAAGVCTPQGVWIRAMERHGSLLTKTLKRTKAQQPEGHKRQGERHGSLLTKTLKRTKAQQPEGHKRQGVL